MQDLLQKIFAVKMRTTVGVGLPTKAVGQALPSQSVRRQACLAQTLAVAQSALGPNRANAAGYGESWGVGLSGTKSNAAN